MPKNTLNKIIIKKEQKLHELKKTISIEALKEKIKENSAFFNFIYMNQTALKKIFFSKYR